MKIKITFLLLLTFIGLRNILAQIDPDSGLVAKYYFNGDTIDDSGNGNHATLHGATLATNRFGDSLSAYELAGNSGMNGSDTYIEIPNIVDGFENLTISMWVKQNSYSYSTYGETYISYGTLPHMGITSTSIFYDEENDRIGFIVMLDSASYYTCYAPYQSSWIGEFQHFALTYNGETGILTGYHNGSVITSKDGIPGTVYALGDYAGIGKHWWAGGEGESTRLNGVFDDVRVYERALDSTEIENLYYENKCIETIYKTVTVHDTIHISVTDTLIIDVSLTSEEKEISGSKNTIKVYPNPEKDVIYINTGDNFSSISDYKIVIIDDTGRTVYSENINDQMISIPLSDFGAEGLYFVKILDSNSNIVDIRKIVLQ